MLRATRDRWLPAEVKLTLAERRPPESAAITIDQRAPVEPVANEARDEDRAVGLLAGGVFIAFGVGAAGPAVGTIFLFKNRGDRDDADAICVNGRCRPRVARRSEDLDKSADQAQTFSRSATASVRSASSRARCSPVPNGSSSSESETGSHGDAVDDGQCGRPRRALLNMKTSALPCFCVRLCPWCSSQAVAGVERVYDDGVAVTLPPEAEAPRRARPTPEATAVRRSTPTPPRTARP